MQDTRRDVNNEVAARDRLAVVFEEVPDQGKAADVGQLRDRFVARVRDQTADHQRMPFRHVSGEFKAPARRERRRVAADGLIPQVR